MQDLDLPTSPFPDSPGSCSVPSGDSPSTSGTDTTPSKYKWALVTGCDHGLGTALVQELIRRGYHVIACRFHPEETVIDGVARENPDQVTVRLLDIGSDQSVQGLKDSLESSIPCIDLLINCAGILGDMESGPDDALNFSRMLDVLNVNALGTLRVTAALLPLVEKSRDKTVLNISSEAGSIGDCERTGWFGYCMSKSANNMQGALIHNTLRKKGGQVIQMHPGHVATFMRGHLDTTAALTPEESATALLHTVLDQKLPVGDRPLYIDYAGHPLPF
ncbi:MAG: SDR family NAD(P)-dependent oxidoreductase [Clostridia bacterium]|nr:SDR family NAD(P)-dependent oxidoreductase [Clostridia bacterium]